MGAPITKDQFMAEGCACIVGSMPVGAAVGYLGAKCFTIINPVAGAWLGMGVISFNAVGLFITKKIIDIQPTSTSRALSSYCIAVMTTTVLGTLLALDTFKLALTTTEVLTLLSVNSAIIGIGIMVSIVAARIFEFNCV